MMQSFRAIMVAALCLLLATSGVLIAHPVARDRTYTRSCDDSVWGSLGRGWRKGSIVVGPLAIVGARASETSRQISTGDARVATALRRC